MAAPMHAADLMTVVVTGSGQDVVDARETMTAQHGEFLTRIMMHSVLDRLDAEKIMQVGDWGTGCEPMRWTPDPVSQGA